MKLLFIADIVGEPGRRVVKQLVPQLRDRLGLDVVIANGENSAGGSGITLKTATEIYSAGVDIITSGDHLWDQKEVSLLLESESRFLRPLNYPPGTPGRGSAIFEVRGAKSDGRSPGAVAVVTDGDLTPLNVAWAKVAHGRRALAALSANFYGRPAEKLAITGITGTNGKSTTAFLLESILQAAGR